MKNLKTFCLVMVLLFVAKPSIGKILFYDDAENGISESEWAIQTDHGNKSISVSTENSRDGNKSYKFTYAPTWTDGRRSHIELVLRAVKPFKYNQEYWMGWSVYIPDNFTMPDGQKGEWGILGQFHGVPDDCETDAQYPMIASYLDGDSGGFKVRIGSTSIKCYDRTNNPPDRNVYYGTRTLKKGEWNDIVLNLRFNYVDNNNPFFKMWLNGQLVVNDQGSNCYNDKTGPYFKLGIYTNLPNPTTLYYDEIRVGDSSSSYDEVAPSGEVVEDTNSNLSLQPPKLEIVNP